MSDQPRGADLQIVCFQLANETYAVDIARVHEIIRMQDITPIPRAPAFVEGVINLRGRVIPVLDLRRRFGFPSGEHTRATRIMVVELGEQTVGLIVDAVTQVFRVQQSMVEPPSPVVAGLDSQYLRGIAKLRDQLVVLLDLDHVLDSAEHRELDAVHPTTT